MPEAWREIYIATTVKCRTNRDFSESRIPNSEFRILNPQSGASLIELIMFIVIVSSALAGILLVMNQTSKGSADPLIRKQAMAAAYSLLEEIELQDAIAASGVASSPVTQANRASAYHVVGDYNGFATTGVFAVADATSSSPVLAQYNAAVSVIPEAAAWNGIPAGRVAQINVTVTGPNNTTIIATGYRAAY